MLITSPEKSKSKSISIKLLLLILIFIILVFRKNEGLGIESIFRGLGFSQLIPNIASVASMPFSIRGSVDINHDLNIIRSFGIGEYYLDKNIAPPVMYENEFFSALYPMKYLGRWNGGNQDQDILILINKNSNCPNQFKKNDLNNFSYCYNFN
jgi:hypothetical protein